MVSRNKIVTTVIILLLLSVLFSGCTEENKIFPAPDSIQKEALNESANLSQPSGEEIIPEIKITSFSSIYMHDNLENIYLFSWENVPGNESNSLLNFLTNDLHIDWIEIYGEKNVQITKDNDNKTIRVFIKDNLIEIMLNNESVILNIRDGGYYNLWVKEENGTHKVYNKKPGNKYISKRYYAAYNLSIKNNGSDPLFFKLNGLRLQEGDRIFNTTTLEHYDKNSSRSGVLHDLANENKLQDTALLPGQSLNGTVAFRVDSLYNESFLLKYDTTTVTSASFEKSIVALRTAENFNYFEALGIFPYTRQREGTGIYQPVFDDNYGTWANWVNRNVFEVFKKSDVEMTLNYSPDFISLTNMVYALKVIPGKNITIFPVTTRFTNHLIIRNDAGTEMINTSDVQHRTDIIGFLNNQTYIQPGKSGNIPQMNISNAYIVQFSFEGTYGCRMSLNNQDVILDDGLNINLVRSEFSQFLS